MAESETGLTLEEAREMRQLLVEIAELSRRLDLTAEDFEQIQAHRDNLQWLVNCTLTVTEDEVEKIALTRANLEWIHGYPPEDDEP